MRQGVLILTFEKKNRKSNGIHRATFHPGMYFVLIQNHFEEKDIQWNLESITCHPSIDIMDHPDITVL